MAVKETHTHTSASVFQTHAQMWYDSQGSLPVLCLIELHLTEVYSHLAVMETNQDTNTRRHPVQQLQNNKS